MFRSVMARLARALTTKVGLALIAALLLGGGATAMAMATTHGQPFANGHLLFNSGGPSASPTTHGHDADDQNDADDKPCTSTGSGTPSASPTHSEDDAVFATATKTATGSNATPTKAAGDDGDEHGHEGAECEGDDHTPKATHSPEPTEGPEGTHTPQPSATKGSGGD